MTTVQVCAKCGKEHRHGHRLCAGCRNTLRKATGSTSRIRGKPGDRGPKPCTGCPDGIRTHGHRYCEVCRRHGPGAKRKAPKKPVPDLWDIPEDDRDDPGECQGPAPAPLPEDIEERLRELERRAGARVELFHPEDIVRAGMKWPW